MSSLSQFLFSIALLSGVSKAMAAACCGGSASMPTIIVGNDKAQMSASYTLTDVAVDYVDSAGYWHRWEEHQRVRTIRLEGAHVFADRWQWGVSLPVMTRELGQQSYSGLGDITTSLNYEYLPDWNYSLYRPKGIGFVQLVAPVSVSRVESRVGGLDSRGNGFLSLGVGTILSKSWRVLDVLGLFEWHRSQSKTIQVDSFSGVVKPGSGRTLSFGLGYNWPKYRLGLSLTQTQEDPVELVSPSRSSQFQDYEQLSTFAVILGYLRSDLSTVSVSYIDQTILGEPINTSLGRGISVQFQKRWSR